jgi:hypothetical protein
MLLARIVGGAEKVTLHARVGGTNDVLALNPAAFTTASAATDSTAAAASASVRAAVSVTVEAAAAAALATAPASLLRGALLETAPVAATTATTAGIEVIVTIRKLVSWAEALRNNHCKVSQLTQPKRCC